MTAVLLVVLLGFTALAVDFGVRYVSGAKLQNAVDAAATAAAASIGDVDQSIEDTAYHYLALNGFDKDDKYKDKINLDIETKGVVDLETVDDEDYITAGFYKLTVEVDENTLFANILGVDSMKIVKTSYVRCRPNYVSMPRALNYTIFAGSTDPRVASFNETNPAAIKVDGRTSDTINSIANFFERAINWTNASIVQPIIGIFGGTPDTNDLVNINLSEIVCNGDVHSNSNIRIGVQALNVSRVKDRDYEGVSDTEQNSAATNHNSGEINDAHDYGQVTFTAIAENSPIKVNGEKRGIVFTNSLKNSNDGKSTHIYVQNQQYLRMTQDFLDALDYVDFAKCSDTAQLRAEFRRVIENDDPEKSFFAQHPDIAKDPTRKAALENQVDLIEFDPSSHQIYLDYDITNGRGLLQNQKQIVYNISHKKAEEILTDFVSELREYHANTPVEDKTPENHPRTLIDVEAGNNLDP
ncbi:MAG: hypothetical protein IJT65_03385, partial [Eubacterium sp.]|nr:hypothetical protein [Eubacterium sp.]